MHLPGQDTKPWYKQFYPWMLIGLPLSSVIAGLTTVYIAHNGADSLVVDDYYKEGLAINEKREKEAQAAKLGVEANLGWNTQSLTINLPENINETAGLQLSFVHPTKQEKDFELALVRLPNGSYQGDLPTNLKGRWKLTLAPMSQSWRIKADIYMDETGTLTLKP